MSSGVVVLLLLIIGLFIFMGKRDSGVEGKKTVKISPEAAKTKLANKPATVVVDVRTPEEYVRKHIPGSILIPLDRLEQEAGEKLPDKGATIIVYCQSGARSVKGAEKLLALEYTDVYDLGGIMFWPYETDKG